MYANGTSVVRLHKDTEKMKIEKGVKPADTCSQKLFTACFEGVFKKFSWESKGISIDEEHLTHLRFSGDIILISNNAEHFQEMLNDLNRESLKVGLKMHKGKTRVMSNDKAQQRVIRVDNKALEVVEEYNYLGQILKLTRDNEHEIKRRITLGWKAFGRQSKIMKSSLPICLKRKIYNQCVLPTMISGSET